MHACVRFCTVIKEEYYILVKIKYIAMAEGGFIFTNLTEVIHVIVYLLEVTIDSRFSLPTSIFPFLVSHRVFFPLQEKFCNRIQSGSVIGN